jgi:Flp pilus assembly protein TadD
MESAPQENTASYWQKLGNSLANSGRYGEAAKAYDKSLSLDPKDAECWNNRGIVQSMQNRMGDAILSFEKGYFPRS